MASMAVLTQNSFIFTAPVQGIPVISTSSAVWVPPVGMLFKGGPGR